MPKAKIIRVRIRILRGKIGAIIIRGCTSGNLHGDENGSNLYQPERFIEEELFKTENLKARKSKEENRNA